MELWKQDVLLRQICELNRLEVALEVIMKRASILDNKVRSVVDDVRSVVDDVRSLFDDMCSFSVAREMFAKPPHYLASNGLDVVDFYMKMRKNYGDDCDKKPAEVPPDNEFEERIRSQVISPGSIGVTFKDIGGLNETKRSLEELVMLPLKRPDLFKGALSKTCRGILLFGPPGTGKTMLAKAIATEAKASFINCSMSTIISNVPGEAEKNVRALFSVAAEVAPTIIFVDDVDRMLAKRKYGEPEFMRILKNEFMSNWDGFMTKPGEKILVLGATNRPFDLDEAAIRRFERRLMVGLPSAEDREEILTVFLSKQRTEGIHIHELARTTGGCTASDLKNLCITALSRPVREFLERKKKALEKEGSQAKEDNTEKEEETITTRALTMEDMEEAKKRVAPSFAVEDALVTELKQWNERYGGGSRKKEPLTYSV